MQTTISIPPRLADYIKELLPWAHGHQLKAVTTYVAAILHEQTGCQARLARTCGNQEAATKRLSRLLHNERLRPPDLAEAVLAQALRHVPATGLVRVTIDWTSEGRQHLLVVSLVMGGRAIPISWRAYDASVLKGRMARYETAVVRRACGRLFRVVAPARIRLTADRGFADLTLFKLLDELGVHDIIRVTGNVQVYLAGAWRKLKTLRFITNQRRRRVGRLLYCEREPHRLTVTMSRARNGKGEWGIWYLVSNHAHRARQMEREYGRRFSCEEGFRDAKWYLGFKQARVARVAAWGRLFALFAIALLVAVSVGMRVLIRGGRRAPDLLRRVVSRRRERCELSLVTAMVNLLKQDRSLFAYLSGHTKFNLEASLANVS